MICPSFDVLPSSVYSAPCSTKTHSSCTVWRNTYGHRCSPEGMLSTSARVLSVQRGQPPHKGLPPPLRRPEVNHGAIGRIDRRFDGLERCSRRRGSWPLPGEGFCLVWPAKSTPRSLLVNRFAVLNIAEVNTDICEPIDAPPLCSGQGSPASEAQMGKETTQMTLCQHPQCLRNIYHPPYRDRYH